MNLLRALVEAFNPCFHQWEVIETLRDRPEDPMVITIVRQCAICSALGTETIKGPPRYVAPDPVCPPHKWATVNTIQLVKYVNAAKKDTRGYQYIQQCTRCGDMRTITQGK
jgi:hypothetical protein